MNAYTFLPIKTEATLSFDSKVVVVNQDKFKMESNLRKQVGMVLVFPLVQLSLSEQNILEEINVSVTQPSPADYHILQPLSLYALPCDTHLFVQRK